MKDGVFERIEARDLFQDWTIPSWYYVLLSTSAIIALVTAQGWALL